MRWQGHRDARRPSALGDGERQQKAELRRLRVEFTPRRRKQLQLLECDQKPGVCLKVTSSEGLIAPELYMAASVNHKC